MVAFKNLPQEIRADAPLWGQVIDLPEDRPVRIEAKLRDGSGHVWRSEAVYRPSPEGIVDLAGTQPVEAGWSGSDAYGLYWSMEPTQSEVESSAPLFEMATASLEPLPVELVVHVEGGVVVHERLERRFISRCTTEAWRDEFVANLFVPIDAAASQGTLVIAGSAGGFAWSNQVAALIAASGRAALAVAYFDWQGAYGLPTSITEIPLETFSRALDRLKRDPRILKEDLAVIGYSKGAEAALLLATKREDVRKVVAFAPTAYIWESVRMDLSESPRSSWTWNGIPVPYIRFAADETFYHTFDKTRLRPFHERALADPAAIREARIPVEDTAAQLLLISGTEDSVWPAGPMAESIVRALRDVGRADQVRHATFEGAGHTFFPPGGPAFRMGGTPAANAYADRKSWGVLRKHLDLS